MHQALRRRVSERIEAEEGYEGETEHVLLRQIIGIEREEEF